MRFICEKCKTKYTISDEKIRGKVLKIRCKNCQNVIEVREPGAPGKVGSEPVKRPRTHGALKARSRHVGAAGRRRPTRPSLAADPGDRRTTGGLRQTRRDGGAVEEEASTTVAPLPRELLRDYEQSQKRKDEGAAVWHLGDDNGQFGPMPFAELAARVERGEPGANAEVWREGFDDWIPLREVKELQPHIKRAPPPRPPTGQRKSKSAPTLRDGDEPVLGAKPASAALDPIALRRPQAAKVTPASREVSDAMLKLPSRPKPAARPLPVTPAVTEDPDEWPAVPSVDEEPAPIPAMTDSTPAPTTESAVEADFFGKAAHVSPAPASSDLAPLLAEQKRARRPALLIGAGVLILSISVIVLVVWLIFFQGKTPSKGGDKVADAMSAMQPGMADMTAVPAVMERELPELDLDIDTVDVFSGEVITRSRSRGRRRSRKRDKPKESMSRRSSSGSSYTTGLPGTMRSFSGIMGFDPSKSSSSSYASSSGGRPANLGNVVRRNYARLKRCYEKAARLNSRMKKARLRIRVKVRRSGRVRSVSVSPSRYQADTLGICVRRSIMAWGFPKFGSDYSYTFGANFMGG